MGKNKANRKYVIISGMNLRDRNRGSAALGYGAFTFLQERGLLPKGKRILQIQSKGNPFRKNRNRVDVTTKVSISGTEWEIETRFVNIIEWRLMLYLGILLPFTKLRKLVNQVEYVAAINGGDGFSDIYNTRLFMGRLGLIKLAMSANKPIIILPQTIGPFHERRNQEIARKILKYAQKVYVRDECFTSELKEMDVSYELTKDLSYYMKPEKWDIDIDKRNAIGINVSGLAYDNKFHSLAGQFGSYPKLIETLIKEFQQKGKTVYLISHSYNYAKPDKYNDDLDAAKRLFNGLENKERVILIDKDLTPPQVKYLISQMSFFVGTRMHANFAAIYTGVPVFGLAYSYKFKGAFDNNGQDSEKQTASVVNLTDSDIPKIISKVFTYYESVNT